MPIPAPTIDRRPRGPLLPALLAALVLAGCASSPSTPPAAPSPAATPEPVVAGEVLARSERLLIYRPAPGDSLRGLAASLLGSEERDWQIAEANGGLQQVEPGQPLVVPLAAPNPLGVLSGSYQTVPVLCYHRLGTGGGKMSVSPAAFAAQMDWLARNNYRVIRLGQLAAYLEGREPLPPRSVVITFDDGYESVHRHALPVLRKHGMPATLFVYTDFIGAGDAVSWPQLQEMADSKLIEVQAHSKSHRNLIERQAGESDERYLQNLEQEIRGPRELLEKRLGIQVRHYAFPYGDANEQVLDQLARQRYTLAVSVNPGGNAFFAQPLLLRRTMIFGDHDLEAFKARLQTSRRIGQNP
ncbi:polysaccharide deacetylase family protein [Roseateles sp. DAIF2]|uniref:polysaccharide deacetylase family protein n=1 Tax=Roseateles sp. DAIF2 TaxID=2714952 RepID=UPI00201E3117|nr:polysaccharide deacetylase family protein [Roseateles sp. DAIF2]